MLHLSLALASSAAFMAPQRAAAPQRHAGPASPVMVASLDKLSDQLVNGDSVKVADGVLKRNAQGRAWVDQRARPRRNRKSEAVRKMVRENFLTPANLLYPLFIHDEDTNVAIPSMPGCERHSLSSMVAEASEAYSYGVKSFVVFPKVADELKTNYGEEAYNPEGIVPRAVRMLKEALPDAVVCTDVALDPYSSKGHDGIVEGSKILNDDTIEQLCKQSICQARAPGETTHCSLPTTCHILLTHRSPMTTYHLLPTTRPARPARAATSSPRRT